MRKDANREFRKIPSLGFLYEVNGDGTIIRNVKSKRHLKCFKKCHLSKTEYWCTQVNYEGRIRKVFLHRVVAECWIGPKPEGMQVDHIDRNSLNNHYSNLRYVDKSEQMLNRDYSTFIDIALANLSTKNGGKLNPVRIIGRGETREFATARRAAKYLMTVYPDKKEKCFNDKFYRRRKRIFDYDVEYLNAETGHGSLERQGTVHSNVYLVGTLDRWNNAKRAEEHDRVKHA